MPHSIIGKIVATPPANITFLNNRELAGLTCAEAIRFETHLQAWPEAKRQPQPAILALILKLKSSHVSKGPVRPPPGIS